MKILLPCPLLVEHAHFGVCTIKRSVTSEQVTSLTADGLGDVLVSS